MNRVLLISGDKELATRVKRALDADATVMLADPAADNVGEIAEQFRPEGVLVDADVSMGARTAFERLSTLRGWFADIPMIVIGNEAGAQLILTAMRAGAQDFIDRDARDDDFRNAVRHHIAESRFRTASLSRLVMALSATQADGDDDFALNMAVTIAAARPNEGVLLVDLGLPASNAAIALGLEMNFRVKDAVKEMSRLDRALLDSALARCPRSGLYVLPLALHGAESDWAMDIHDLRALLEICQSLYDVVIVSCGPFSRQEEILSLPEEGAPFFLPCTQRFTSIKAAAEMLRFVRNLRGGRDEPVLMIHEFAPGMAPDPVSIRNAVGAARALELPADWRELAESVNRGEPLALVPSSHYAREMSRHMQALNLTPRVEEDHGSATSLRNLTRRLRAVLS
jgi:pilus assembly protein CpaE